MRKVVWLAVAVCLGLTADLPGAKKTGPETVEKTVAKPSLAQLIEQLGDRRYRIRERAQRFLAEMDDGVALPVLIKARLNTRDSEVVRRLDGLIPAMERSALLKPRRVSLNLEKRTLQEIVAELSRQTGYGIDMDNITTETFTFKFDNVPFWEALDKICQAARVNIYPNNYYGGGNDRIRLGSQGASGFIAYFQSFRLVAGNGHYQRFINYTGSSAAPASHSRSESLTFNCTIHSEPKLPIMQVFAPEISEAFDENKKPMAIKVVPNTSHYMNDGMGYSRYGNGYRTFSMASSFNLLRPTRDSKMVKFIKGEIPVLLSQEMPDIVIDQPVSVKKKKFKKSITELEIEDITEANWGNGKSYMLKLSVKEDSDMKYNDYNWMNTLAFHFELLDAKGNKYLSQNQGLNSLGPRVAKGSIQFYPQGNVALGPPVKLVYNKWVPVNHRIKFELHNLPLP